MRLNQAFGIHSYVSIQEIIHLFRGHKSEYHTKNAGMTRTGNTESPKRRTNTFLRKRSLRQGTKHDLRDEVFKAWLKVQRASLSWCVAPSNTTDKGKEQSPRLNLMTTSGPKKKCFPPRSLWFLSWHQPNAELCLAPPSEMTEYWAFYKPKLRKG